MFRAVLPDQMFHTKIQNTVFLFMKQVKTKNPKHTLKEHRIVESTGKWDYILAIPLTSQVILC